MPIPVADSFQPHPSKCGPLLFNQNFYFHGGFSSFQLTTQTQEYPLGFSITSGAPTTSI